jgi:HK97 family phage portal protein
MSGPLVIQTRTGLRARVAAAFKSLIGVGDEGSWRGPFFGMTEFGNWRELGPLEDGWQKYLKINRRAVHSIPVVAAIRHLHRSAFAQLRPAHKRKSASGEITVQTGTAQARVLLAPNDYETWSDFAARLVDEWLTRGEVVVLGVRNGREEVVALHILSRDMWTLLVDPESRAIFYGVNDSGELLIDGGLTRSTMAIPARDILHLRWATPRHPLIGESAFAAAGVSAGIHVALSHSQLAFFSNMRRPSGFISTDQLVTQVQMDDLRKNFDEKSKAWEKGGVPIMQAGMKWNAMTMTSADAEVIATLRMENEEIARTCGVPPPLVGDLSHASLTATEPLIAIWLSISLGGLIERFERGLDRLLGLDGEKDWIDLDVIALLRTDFAARMDAYAKGIQGGALYPNDARRMEGLSPAEGGEQLFMQKQMTPVNLLAEMAGAELVKLTAPPPPPPPPPGDGPPPVDPAAEEQVARALTRDAIAKAAA